MNNHPIAKDFADYLKTPEGKVQRLLHDEASLFDGFRDGWLYGRKRREHLKEGSK